MKRWSRQGVEGLLFWSFTYVVVIALADYFEDTESSLSEVDLQVLLWLKIFQIWCNQFILRYTFSLIFYAFILEPHKQI